MSRFIADAAMDRRLRQYLDEARRSGDRARLADAERAQQIRDNPKFLSLVDLLEGMEIPEIRGRTTPATERMLDTGSIRLEPDMQRRKRLAAAKQDLAVLLRDLYPDHEAHPDAVRQVLTMVRDWSQARLHHRLRAARFRLQRARTAAAVS